MLTFKRLKVKKKIKGQRRTLLNNLLNWYCMKNCHSNIISISHFLNVYYGLSVLYAVYTLFHTTLYQPSKASYLFAEEEKRSLVAGKRLIQSHRKEISSGERPSMNFW